MESCDELDTSTASASRPKKGKGRGFIRQTEEPSSVLSHEPDVWNEPEPEPQNSNGNRPKIHQDSANDCDDDASVSTLKKAPLHVDERGKSAIANPSNESMEDSWGNDDAEKSCRNSSNEEWTNTMNKSSNKVIGNSSDNSFSKAKPTSTDNLWDNSNSSKVNKEKNEWDTVQSDWKDSKKVSNDDDSWNTSGWGGGDDFAQTGSNQKFSSRGGGSGCRKCGEDGHFARECPKGGGGGGRGFGSNSSSSGCRKCGEDGHFARECPKGGSSRGCFKCGQDGHRAADCTSTGGNSHDKGNRYNHRDQGNKDSARTWDDMDTSWGENKGSSGRKIYDQKGAQGNYSNSSETTNRNDDGWGETSGWGKNAEDSNAKPRSGGFRKDSGSNSGCRKCGENGHFARECPQGSGNSARGSGCFKCGEEGHRANECTQEVLGPDGKPRPPLYKPPELDENDESLFKDTIAPGSNFMTSVIQAACRAEGQDWGENDCYNSFTESIKSQTLLEALKISGIDAPTPIQKYGMKVVDAGRDLMAIAQTGSGKTLAFLLPILQALFNDGNLPNNYGLECQEPLVLILTPTRELAIQIHEVCFKYIRGTILKTGILYGKTCVEHQRAQISKGIHILTGTTGRVLHFVKRGYVSFSKTRYLVLDEADRMVDDGFIPDVRSIITHGNMPGTDKRQTLMYSATFLTRVQNIAAEFLKNNYVFVTAGVVGGANVDISQEIIKVERNAKRSKLLEILGTTEIKDRTMIFVESKKTADFLGAYLSQSEYKATTIHGDRYQNQREEALRDLKSGKFPILVATNLASRGLDIKDVRHVINYDLPKQIDDYIHRIGRTGRVGNLGRATSFYDPNNPNDRQLAKELVQVMNKGLKDPPGWLVEEAGESGSTLEANNGFSAVDARNVVSYANLDEAQNCDFDAW